jgi:hypothetical protein
MMYLHPPFLEYEGVTVAPDSSDPLQFWYLPNRPHLAVDNGRPAIRFLVLKENLDELTPGEEAATGFLVFDTVLSWPEETLKKVAAKIKDDLHLEGDPRLAPLLFKSGTTRLVFLDRQTTLPGDKPADAPKDSQPGGTDQWVTFLEASGIPSLYGENRAIFSAVLTKKATQLLYGAFEGFTPAGVIYDLQFIGMQRAFNIHVTADWEQVYHHLEEGHSVSAIFYSSDVKKVVDDLIDKKVIDFQVTLEGIGEEGMEGEMNEVRKQIQDFVMDKFFTPQPNPNKPSDTPGAIVDTMRALRDLASPISCGYTRKELDATEIRTLDIDYTAARAVERTIAPQAHLSFFFADYNIKKDQVITVVDGDDDFWRQAQLSILADANFDGDGISTVAIDVAYGAAVPPGPDDRVWSFLADKGHTLFEKASWFDPAVGNRWQYRYDARFSSSAVPGPEVGVESGWRQASGTALVVSPAELYAKRRLEFDLGKGFPADQYPTVQVDIRYVDPDTNWTYDTSGLLDAAHPTLVFIFRTRRDAPRDVQYRFTYTHGSGPVVTDWRTTAADLVLVDDPRPNIFTVRVVVAGDRSKIEDLLLDFQYQDEEHGIFETGSLRYDQKTINDPQQWSVPLADPNRHRYSYSQTLVTTDGEVLSTGWVQDDRRTLPVGEIYARRWEVQPELVGPAFADDGLAQVKLALHYRDDGNGVALDKQMTFGGPGKGDVWELQLKDPSMRQYAYEVTYVLSTGFERKLTGNSSDTFLVLSSVPPAE